MIDEVTFKVKAGNGGNGAVSFHRAKYIPKGGPDGGDGGNGGSIFLVAEKGINTLSFFAGRDRFEADNGGKGSGSKRHGENAEDITLKVPVGTVVWEVSKPEFGVEASTRSLSDFKNDSYQKTGIDSGLDDVTVNKVGVLSSDAPQDRHDLRVPQPQTPADIGGRKMIFDLVEDGQKVCIAQGGVGGRGNFQFRSSVNTTPLEYEEGTRGEKKVIQLELKVLAQIGLVGLPNAGKSTLLSILTKAQPKIANYPFTTLTPNLGAMKLPGRQDHLVIADIPGLIEGASAGKGLGIQFLRHIERCRILLYMVAPTDEVLGQDVKVMEKDLTRQYEEVRKELSEYKKELLDLPSIVVINKIDLVEEKTMVKVREKLGSKYPTVLAISAATSQGVDDLKLEIAKKFNALAG